MYSYKTRGYFRSNDTPQSHTHMRSPKILLVALYIYIQINIAKRVFSTLEGTKNK